MNGLRFSEKELQQILRRPGYSAQGGTEKRKAVSLPKPDCSKLEAKFMQLWQLANGPELEREYKFHPDRRFRFDFAHVETKTAIECEGFGHNKMNRYTSDVEKYNLAALEGWKVYRLTGKMINVIELQKVIDFIRAKEG